jgi:hypothetical protein
MIKWTKFLIVDKLTHSNYCQIDSISDGNYILSYSNFATSYSQILRINNAINKSKQLYESTTKSIVSLYLNDSLICFSGVGWNNKIQLPFLIISYDQGKSWKDLQTPLEFISMFITHNSNIIVEGNLQGTTHIFESFDSGRTWKEINFLQLGFKSIHLNTYDIYGSKAIAQGSRTFSQKDNQLLLWDFKKNKITEILDLGDKKYIKPISKNRSLHGVIAKNSITIYSLDMDKIHFDRKFNIPKNIGDVKNIYLNEKLYILTTREEKIEGKTISWISYNQGENWEIYNQAEEYQLIYNTFGGLFMKDKNSNLLSGEPLTHPHL